MPDPYGGRKVVLATSIAETSLTIEGVRTVVDTGLYRKPVFDPRTGLTHLEVTTVSRDMAEQRAGRAGRVAEGTCMRLWTKAAETHMEEHRHAEIEDADFAPTLLSIASFGETDIMSMPWLTLPPRRNVANAHALLVMLGGITDDGVITPTGKHMAALPCHPRIARMILGAGSARMRALACDIAARNRAAQSGQAANANAAPFVIVAGWGLFTVANTLSTKFGLLLVAGSTAFLIYNVAIMTSLAALIVVEFLPRRAMQDELAPQETPQAALSEQGSNTEELIAQRCAQLAERYGLTDREREVLVPLVRGRSAASIAAQLSMSTETARTHIRHIYQKTDIHSREELMDIVDGM